MLPLKTNPVKQMMPKAAKWINNRWTPLIVLSAVSVIIYLPILHNSFLADDFQVMNRVGLQGELLIPGFFRPLSDISLYINYLFDGLDPFGYYLTNALLHAGTAYMLYGFCVRTADIFTNSKYPFEFAWLAALLFVSYPFHNESIAWVVGRASLLAGFFAAACLLVSVTSYRQAIRFLLCALFYFIGLMAYESIFPLPFIVIVICWIRSPSRKTFFKWSFVFLITLVVHFIARRIFSGVMADTYGETVFSPDILRHFNNFFKVAGRLLLPPSDNSGLLQILFGFILVCLVMLWILSIRRKGFSLTAPETLLIMFLGSAVLVPTLFAISTRTSEGDRLLYFPSYFLSLFGAFLLTEGLKNKRMMFSVFTALIIYQLIFLEINNANWRKSSAIAVSVLAQVPELLSLGRKLVFVNLPGEVDGAYIFRNAFDEAILLNGLDTNGVRIINYLNNAEYKSLPDKVIPEFRADTVVLGKTVRIYSGVLHHRPEEKTFGENSDLQLEPDTEIWYWTKHRLEKLDAAHSSINAGKSSGN